MPINRNSMRQTSVQHQAQLPCWFYLGVLRGSDHNSYHMHAAAFAYEHLGVISDIMCDSDLAYFLKNIFAWKLLLRNYLNKRKKKNLECLLFHLY